MTLTVKLELSGEMEAELREGIVLQNPERVRQILVKALAPTVEELLQHSPGSLSDEKFERVADRLADMLAERMDPNTPILSERVLSRAAIYADHP